MMAMLTLTEANSMLISENQSGSSERLVSAGFLNDFFVSIPTPDLIVKASVSFLCCFSCEIIVYVAI